MTTDQEHGPSDGSKVDIAAVAREIPVVRGSPVKLWKWLASSTLALAAWSTLLSCTTPRGATWDDAVAPSPAPATPPPIVRPASHPLFPTGDVDTAEQTAGVLIDRALITFNSARIKARTQPTVSTAAGDAWLTCLAAIDDAVTRPPVAADVWAFVRARVTLEVELKADQDRGVLLPSGLATRVAHTLLAVDESVVELRAANAPGSFAPVSRLGDDELVLRAPIAPMIISSKFGRRRDPFTASVRYHAGTDLSAPLGAAVYAAASGVVVYAGPQGGYGRYIVLDHGDGIRTHYAHLSRIHVKAGGVVVEGDVIGMVGSTGRSTGPHLHFAVTNELGVFLDPMAVLDLPFAAMRDQIPEKPR